MAINDEIRRTQQELANRNTSRAGLRSNQDLANMYGITYDAASIEAKFNEATKAEYDMLRKEYQATENQYYNNMYNNQASALDAIRRSQAQAVATGASRGMNAANELSSILNLQQEGVAGATQLATDRNLLMDKEAAAYAKNSTEAFNKSNELGMALGNLGANLYASDTQFDVANLDYYARLDASLKGLLGTQEQANAQRYAADQARMAQENAAAMSAAAQKYAAQISADAQKYSANQSAEAQIKASLHAAGASREVQDAFEQQANSYMNGGNVSALTTLYMKQAGMTYQQAYDFAQKDIAKYTKTNNSTLSTTGKYQSDAWMGMRNVQ